MTSEQSSGPVLRAPRRERVRRMAWMLGSGAVTLIVITTAVEMMAQFGVDRMTTVAAVAIFAVDLHVFSWGVERFDITLPKEFRDDG